jgi:16S rRNA (guanine527-N7)-methyltransferase
MILLAEHAQRFGLELSEAVLARIAEFEDALYRHNEVKNLTRIPREHSWSRHFLDSLVISPDIPLEATVIDIGCGPGFPSWPLAIARPDLEVTAVDSNGKMLDFLKAHPLPNLTIVYGRAEDLGKKRKFGIATGRAVAPLALQLELSAPFVTPGGSVVVMHTLNENLLAPDFERLGLDKPVVRKYVLPHDGLERVIAKYAKSGPGELKFPRPWADMKKKPLVRQSAKA